MRYYYRANNAQAEYKALLTDAREGIPLNKEKFYETDRIITGGLNNGQHIYHIMSNSPEIICSKSTVYRHFHKGYYSASLIDLISPGPSSSNHAGLVKKIMFLPDSRLDALMMNFWTL